ncbi:MAG: hypothetical protein Q9162_003159 [Coniocarpon cinnabarinum]
MSPDHYEYARGGAESERTVGYCVHPKIRPTLGPNARIADIGTATGAWLEACNEELGTGITLDGFDISDLNFPPPERTSPNVHFHIVDAKQPFAAQFLGQYDLVHIRFMASANTRDCWAVMARCVIPLLKPGGYIQWEEPDLWQVRVLRNEADSCTDNLGHLVHYWSSSVGENLLYGFSTLPHIYQLLGLVERFEDVIASDRLLHNRIPSSKISAQAAFGWARLRAGNGAAGALSMEQLDELERAVERDFDSGAYIRYDIFVIVGRKPLQ